MRMVMRTSMGTSGTAWVVVCFAALLQLTSRCEAFFTPARRLVVVQQQQIQPRSVLLDNNKLLFSSVPHLLGTTTSTATNSRIAFPSRRRSTTLAAFPLDAVASSTNSLVQTLFSAGPVPFLPAAGLNAVLFALLSSKLLKMLTPTGFWHAMALGTGLWMTLGWQGWTYCVLYLFLGSLVTKIRFAEKEKRGLAEGRGGRRGPENVWGSAATGLACAICASKATPYLLGMRSDVFVLAYCASIATKLSDTFASEIGKAYGKTTFLITNLKRVEPGTEGAVSAEGTAAALLGGLVLSLYGYAVGLMDAPSVVVSTVAAFLATNAESVLGATLQGKEGFNWMTNEVVNAINTLIGASLAVAGGVFVLGMR